LKLSEEERISQLESSYRRFFGTRHDNSEGAVPIVLGTSLAEPTKNRVRMRAPANTIIQF